MRRLGVLTIAILVNLFVLPARADAWYQWLEHLSGPGPFNGLSIDVRLSCFAKPHRPTPPEKAFQIWVGQVRLDLAKLREDSIRAEALLRPVESRYRQRGLPGASTLTRIHDIQSTTRSVRMISDSTISAIDRADRLIMTGKDIREIEARLRLLVPTIDQFNRATALLFFPVIPQLAPLPGAPAAASPDQNDARVSTAEPDPDRRELISLQEGLQRIGDGFLTKSRLDELADSVGTNAHDIELDGGAVVAFLPFAGIIYTVCPVEDDIRRWGSINIDTRWLWTTDKSRENAFADGHKINFLSLVPTFTLRPFHLRQDQLTYWDFFDLSIGMGGYWMRSEGFDTLTGLVIEPRVDLHLPSATARNMSWKSAVAKSLTLRVGKVSFPNGFEQNAFGANLTGQKAQAIPSESQWSVAIYADAGPFRYLMHNRSKP